MRRNTKNILMDRLRRNNQNVWMKTHAENRLGVAFGLYYGGIFSLVLWLIFAACWFVF